MEELARRGFRGVTLWTAAWNQALAFYEACGWMPDGATRHRNLAGRRFTEVRHRTVVPS
jgi:hypothetical protein